MKLEKHQLDIKKRPCDLILAGEVGLAPLRYHAWFVHWTNRSSPILLELFQRLSIKKGLKTLYLRVMTKISLFNIVLICVLTICNLFHIKNTRSFERVNPIQDCNNFNIFSSLFFIPWQTKIFSFNFTLRFTIFPKYYTLHIVFFKIAF